MKKRKEKKLEQRGFLKVEAMRETIKENLIFGREEMMKNEFTEGIDDLIKAACQESYAREFIEKSPD